ncbi:hypothetical protein M7784_04105 [Desulfovibrio aminophilus]|nr:hypothetical protein [Desulfovibrio aminophilus]MCM0754426.1 hypothetical protein [Desulfovibrio aminophilus]
MNIRNRLARLERDAEDRRPPLPTTCILADMDGTAVVDGVRYPSVAAAQEANPSPSGVFVVMQVVDCRLEPEVDHAA